MEMIVLLLLCLLGSMCQTEALSVTGELGEAITIKCSHVNAFSNVKYFCKGACENEDILISSRKNKKYSDGKYSIRDEGNIFYVTISHLTKEDSGTYKCGIERFGFDTYNQVILTVIEGNKKKPENVFSDSPQLIPNEEINPTASSSKKLVYVGAGLGAVVLALAIVLLIFFRYRSREISASSGKGRGTDYATPCRQKQDARHIKTSSSTTKENQEPHQTTSKHHTDNIYSNVNVSSESQIQPDGLVYSTVSFNKHTDCSTGTPPTVAVTYSTVNYDTSAVYCNV